MKSSSWENLPKDILDSVLDNLFKFPYVDYSRCGFVCKSWLNVAAENFERKSQRYDLRTPLLMASDVLGNLAFFRKGSNDKVFEFNLPDDLFGHRIKDSSRGWLAFVSEQKIVTLLPFYRKQIRIPHPIEFSPEKIIVSTRNCRCSTINEANYVVAAKLEHNKLAYIRFGQNWTYIDDDSGVEVDDIIFRKGKLHAVFQCGKIMIVDVSKSTFAQREPMFIEPSIPRLISNGHRLYLAISSSSSSSSIGGDLLVYVVYYRSFTGQSAVRVFRIGRLWNGKADWIELKASFEEVSFLGRNESVNFLKGPEDWGSNCVYLLENGSEEEEDDDELSMEWKDRTGHQLRVLKLDDKGITTSSYKCVNQSWHWHPYWFFLGLPSFQLKKDGERPKKQAEFKSSGGGGVKGQQANKRSRIQRENRTARTDIADEATISDELLSMLREVRKKSRS